MTDTAWQKSSYSGGTTGNECVEVSAASGHIRLREGDDERVVVAVAHTALAAMLRHVRATGSIVRP